MNVTYVDYMVDEEGAKFRINVQDWYYWTHMKELPEEIQERLSLMLLARGEDIHAPVEYNALQNDIIIKVPGVGRFEKQKKDNRLGWFIFLLAPNDFKEFKNGNNTGR